MQRQRGELVPIADALADLPGPVQALHPNRPPQRGFTLADQVNQLVGASEADPDLGFMARLMALCSLPRSNPGNRHQYKRVNGPYRLYMQAGPETKLPFGNLPRLILAWVSNRSRADPKPGAIPGEIALRVHAGARRVRQQRKNANPAPQSNEAAV